MAKLVTPFPAKLRSGRIPKTANSAEPVGRKSLQPPRRRGAAPSASPQSPAYSHRAGLSSQSGSGWDILLHCEPAGPPVGFAGDTNRCIAGGGSAVHARTPFHIDAWVVLPDHMHCLWTLFEPRAGYCREGDADFPGRWRAIKKGFSKSVRIGEPRSPVMIRRGERGIWQRRYWEHTIRDEQDFATHFDYGSFQSGVKRFA
jgi:REP element-mobilizing transposase RayT